jgi:putative sterol carrier protein
VTEQLTTIADVFEVMPSRFDAEAARGLDATYQFDLTGVDGGTYHIKVADGRCEVGEGRAASPNITITMTASDYLDMINGLLNPQMAFMGGKLKIKGDMSLALKMQEIFPTAS